MKRVALLLAAGALGAVASVGVGHAAADDQAKVDAAIAVFEQRVTDAGFVDTGPSDSTSDTVGGTTTGSSDVLAEEPQSFDALLRRPGVGAREHQRRCRGPNGACGVRQLHVHGGTDDGDHRGVRPGAGART